MILIWTVNVAINKLTEIYKNITINRYICKKILSKSENKYYITNLTLLGATMANVWCLFREDMSTGSSYNDENVGDKIKKILRIKHNYARFMLFYPCNKIVWNCRLHIVYTIIFWVSCPTEWFWFHEDMFTSSSDTINTVARNVGIFKQFDSNHNVIIYSLWWIFKRHHKWG